MFGIIKKLLQPAAPRFDANESQKEVLPLPAAVQFNVPELKGDTRDGISRNQKKYLDDLKIPDCENLSLMQAGLVISCAEYVRLLYADNFDCNSNLCPPLLYLNMLPFMLSRPDICDYVIKWNETIFMRESAKIRPFARRRDNPIHAEIQRKFTEYSSRLTA